MSDLSSSSVLHLSQARVMVIGLGLMGGSLALALHGKCARLMGADPDALVRSMAIQRQVVEQVAENPAALLPEADLVVLAAPVRAIISLIQELPLLHPGKAVVVDLGSTKMEVVNAMRCLPERLEAIGGHPMCGKESGSLAQAEAALYRNAPFALVSLPNSTAQAGSLLLEMVDAIGAYPLCIDAQVHDRWVSATSHLPYLLANALAAITPTEAAPMIGPGFRSSARLAPAQRQMMMDILITNQSHVLEDLGRFRLQLERIEDALARSDFAALNQMLSQGALRYDEILDRAEKRE